MTDRGPSPQELAQLAQACGVRILSTVITSGGHRAYQLDAVTHANKVRLLDALADYDSCDPEVRKIAEDVAAFYSGGTLDTAVGLHELVRDGVEHCLEPTELFQHTMRTLEVGRGDCDDQARALVALLRSIGIRARMATLGDPPRHVAAQFHDGARWWWAETSIAAVAGEHPLQAAKRLGIKTRKDLTG